MKKLTLIVAAFAALFTAEANAQLKNDTEGYQRAEVSFAAQTFDWGNSTETDLKGFELGYINGISLTTKLPIFLELGGQLTWTHAKDDIMGGEIKHTFMSLAIPVNAAYKFAFASSETVTIVPFVGPNFKFNLIGKEKFGDEKFSYLSKDDMGDDRAKRFQVGLNLGVGVNLNKTFYVGYHFQPDFADYLDGVKAKTNYITVGINF